MDEKGTGRKGIGERFHEETKYDPDRMEAHVLDWRTMPSPFKTYANPLSRISLPQPRVSGDRDIWKALQQRRSRRDFDGRLALSLETLSILFWAIQGTTARFGDMAFRTAPSAGGLFPIETYLQARYVDGLKPGIYHFRPREFDLEYLLDKDVSGDLAEAALGQNLLRDAQVAFVWSAVVGRSRWKYRQRAYRYIYLDAGHIGQNLYLAGEALGLGVCAIGAFYDDLVNDLLGLDGVEETVVYLSAVGHPLSPNPSR